MFQDLLNLPLNYISVCAYACTVPTPVSTFTPPPNRLPCTGIHSSGEMNLAVVCRMLEARWGTSKYQSFKLESPELVHMGGPEQEEDCENSKKSTVCGAQGT